ncbi:phage virion morphogenesis protein [Pseudomethylobacillus aquaticus]
MSEISELLLESAEDAFDQQQSPFGLPWKPLQNPSERRGGGGSVLKSCRILGCWLRASMPATDLTLLS